MSDNYSQVYLKQLNRSDNCVITSKKEVSIEIPSGSGLSFNEYSKSRYQRYQVGFSPPPFKPVEWPGMEKTGFTSEDYGLVVQLRIDGRFFPEVEELTIESEMCTDDAGDPVNLFLHLVGFPHLKKLAIDGRIVVISLRTEELPSLWSLQMKRSETSWKYVDLPALSYISCNDWEIPPPPGKYRLENSRRRKTRYPSRSRGSRKDGPSRRSPPSSALSDASAEILTIEKASTSITDYTVCPETIPVTKEIEKQTEEIDEQNAWPVLGQIRSTPSNSVPLWPRKTMTSAKTESISSDKGLGGARQRTKESQLVFTNASRHR